MISLSDIAGQETARRILLGSFNRSRLASTYLFYGPDGRGKWPLALALAAVLNCEKPRRDEQGEVSEPCGECRPCRQIGNLAFSELLFALPLPPHKNETEALEQQQEFLTAKREEPYRIILSSRQMTIPIEMAREIRRKTAIMPPRGVKRVILFYQMEKMLPASADSLLKLIEEPPPETIIILTATDPNNLLPTIQSRAQKIYFRPVPEPKIAAYLISKFGVAPEKAALAARLAAGSLGRALDYLDEEGELAARQSSFFVFKNIFQKDSASAVAALNEIINPNNRGETERMLQHWQSFLGDLICLKHAGGRADIQNIDFAAELEKLVTGAEDAACYGRILGDFKRLSLDLRRNAHIRPALTALVLKIRRHLNQSA